MIVDEELDELEKQLTEKKQTQLEIPQSKFSQRMEDVTQNVLADASQTDKKFVNTIVENVKDTAVKYTQVEQEKANLEKQKVQYESETIGAKQQATANRVAEDNWTNKQKRREYHYNGVKSIMQFVGIDEPMNLFFLYFFATILIVPFFVSKLFRGTIGALLCGAENENRSKAARGFIWTMLAILFMTCIICAIYLFLQWQGIDILKKFKS